MDEHIKNAEQAMVSIQAIFFGQIEPEPCPHGWTIRTHCPCCVKDDKTKAHKETMERLRQIKTKVDEQLLE